MSNYKLYLGKLDVRAVKSLESKAFKGKNGDYLNVAVFVTDEPDQFGNSVSISFGEKGEKKVYLCNAKEFSKETTPF